MFVYVRITDTVEDMIFSTFLASRFKALYTRHIRAGKMIIKLQGVLYLLGKVRKDARAVATLVISHLDVPDLSTYLLKRTSFHDSGQ